MDKGAVKLLMYWIKERQSIHLKKEAGKKWPWTKDPILQEYRFCNVYRENDRETLWIHDNWLHPNSKDPHIWFAMCVARLINWSPTLQEIGYPVPWEPAKVIRKMKKLRKDGNKIFTGAYIVSTNGKKMDKVEYIVKKVLTPLWKDRSKIRPEPWDTLSEFHTRLMEYDGMGSFMAAQVIADTKHVGVLKDACDNYTFAASGPGSRRGLNRVLGRDAKSPWKEELWAMELFHLHTEIEKKLDMGIDAQNLQNCLCEFDKYMRVKNGEGRPRSRYRRPE